MMRITVACAIVVASALCGHSAAASQQRRCRLIAELIQAIHEMRIRMVVHLEPIETVLKNSGTTLFRNVAVRIGEYGSIYDAWISARGQLTARGCSADCLGEGEIHVLDVMFSGLGESGKHQQDLLLRTCAAELETIAKSEKNRLEQISRLYTTLGMLLGLMIAVVLI